MKLSIRKEGGGGGGGSAAPSIAVSCFDLKPFIATLAVLTLLLAVWQLQPYESLLPSRFSSSCVLSSNTTSRISISNHSSSSSNISSTTTLPPSNVTTTTTPSVTQVPQKKLSFTVSLSSVVALNSTRPTRNPAPADPNKRVFTPYGNAAALFVQMGAYRGGPRTFAVVGLASKPIHVYGSPYFKCEWVPRPTPSNPKPVPLRTKAYKMLPDWGYGRVYTVVVVNCTFPSNPNSDNAGGALVVHAYYSTSSRKYEKFVALEEAPGSYNESQFNPPYKYEYLYCGSSLYGDLNPSRMREWIAYHAHFFGPKSHFVFHDAGGIRPEVRVVLEPWIKAGRLTIQDIRAQSEYDGYYYNQFLVVNDCLHRHRYAANWTFFFDVDEFLYLPTGESLKSVLGKLKRFTQFTIEQNPMSSKLCVLDSTRNYSREWGFEKLLFRNSITGIRRDRKYAIQARYAYSAGVHMSQNVFGRTTHKTESLIRYYHYHNSINVLGEPCQEYVPVPAKDTKVWFEGIPYVYDDTMRQLAGTIKKFEKENIGTSQT
ncbi:hypothetical protein LUZ62_045203 [Rhynchospora pubera]|uniref:Glycosyltransferase family 92 protein n=1 Tax=Rhynchospora pubera TaxID=906938 RepID=A0AAV8FKZ0_9POAL|nr:hypothetical protein LUZ62_045203 [Rhynchospora pubera]